MTLEGSKVNGFGFGIHRQGLIAMLRKLADDIDRNSAVVQSVSVTQKHQPDEFSTTTVVIEFYDSDIVPP